MYRAGRFLLALWLTPVGLVGCDGAEAATGGGAGPRCVAAPDGPTDQGYAAHGENLHPPLLRRVEAVACSDHAGAECLIDDDCGTAQGSETYVCVCRSVGSALKNTCVPAACRSDSDCPSGACLLSRVEGTACCPAGLFCLKDESSCCSGGDCPGNGTACVYVAERDHFACSLRACDCE